MTISEGTEVTIIMATFNRSHLIGESLDAILNQSFKNWECLVIDDGSKDETEKIVYTYTSRDSRVKYLKRPRTYRKGLPGCRNYGLDMAKGEYVMFFDDDDIPHPNNLQICVKELQNSSYSYCRYLREIFTGEFEYSFNLCLNYTCSELCMENIKEIVMGNIAFNSCQVMWRKRCFNENRFNENLMYAEEWECYLRILSNGVIGISVDKVLFYGRKHPDSNTGEFYNNDSVRRSSYSLAVKLVIENLRKKNLLSSELKQYFIRMGFFFKDYTIINFTLRAFDSSIIERTKYKLGFIFYPAVKKYFNLANDLRNRTGR